MLGSPAAWGDITGTVDAQTDLQTALDAKAAASHTHAASEITGTAVVTNDARLSDARTPTAHVHPQSEVTNLATDLAAKAPLASPAFTGTPTGITKTHVGLGNVDNTTDAGKPVSTAQQTALDAKQATLVSATTIKTVNGTSLLGSGDIAVGVGAAVWGALTGTLSDQTDLQTALNAKAASGHAHVASDVTGTAVLTADARLSDARTPLAHTHTGVYEPANANIQVHVASAHAPSNAQANSDITKAEIEAKLTGAISSHSHAGGSAPVYTLLANGTTAMAFGVNDVVKVTPTATATYTTTVPAAGTTKTLIILTTGTTSRTITFGSGFKPVGTLATGTTSGRVFAVHFVSDGANLYEAGRTAAIVA